MLHLLQIDSDLPAADEQLSLHHLWSWPALSALGGQEDWSIFCRRNHFSWL